MVSGSPYISVNSATINPMKMPIVRHSTPPFGRTKLIAKNMNSTTLSATTVHIPYANAELSDPYIFAIQSRGGVPFLMMLRVTATALIFESFSLCSLWVSSPFSRNRSVRHNTADHTALYTAIAKG